MSYVVLARRYRPKNFDELIGQDHISHTLKAAVEQQRTSHAYLFSGPRGTGKTSSARILSKALRCLNPAGDGNPCNSCVSCAQINQGNSMDVIEIDAASNNGVDNIRDLRENVHYAATLGTYRVYIVDEVHMLSTAAFNALLKTLEEPPEHVVFILATTELHKVPVTVQSRCQRFDFKKLPAGKVRENLNNICTQEKITIDEASMNTLVLESEGCLRDAQSLLDRSLALCGKQITIEALTDALGLMDRTAFFTLLRAIGDHKSGDALERVVAMVQQGVDAKVILSRVVDFLRQLHYYFFTKKDPYPDEEMNQVVRELAGKLSVDEIVRAIDLALRTQATVTSASDNAMMVEALVVKLCLQRPVGGGAPIKRVPTATSTTSKVIEPAAFKKKIPSVAVPEAKPIERSPIQQSAPVEESKEAVVVGEMDGDLKSALEKYITAQKPAWMPVLQAILSLERQGDNIQIVATENFAGKRLASYDGQELVKTALKAKHAVIDLQSMGVPKKQVSLKEKKQNARENEDVQAALKVFKGAKITETKILSEDS